MMMKHLFLGLVVLALSCQDEEKKDNTPSAIEVSSDKIQPDKTGVPPAAPEIKPGPFVEYHPNGEVKMKGNYGQTLEREGLWVAYYDNGIKWSESYYTKGILDGHSLTFYPNGNIRYMGEYKAGTQIGTWTFYDENGNITKEEKY